MIRTTNLEDRIKEIDRPWSPIEIAVIPKGTEHCPKGLESSYFLPFEPYLLQTRGD